MLAIIGANGAGKSTLINAIDVALFGSRSLGEWYPREGNGDPLQIELLFEHGGDVFRVRRSFSPKGRGVAKVDFEAQVVLPADGTHDEGPVWEPLTMESIAETNARIEALIGLSRDTFRASSFLAEGETGRFCDAQPRERKACLAEIVGLAGWDAHLERARKEKRAVEDELAKIAGQVEQAEGELLERSLIEQEHAEALAATESIQGSLREATAALTTAREALAEQQRRSETRRDAEKAVQSAEATLSDLQAGITRREGEIAAADVSLAKRDRLTEVVADLPRLREEQETYRVRFQQAEERKRLDGELVGLRRVRESLSVQALEMERRAISALEHVGEDRCDRCEQILGEDAARRAAESYRDDAKKLLAQVDGALVDIAKAEASLVDLPDDVDQAGRDYAAKLPEMIRMREGAQQQLAQMDELVARRATAQGALDEMRAGLAVREDAVASARAALGKVGPHDPSVQAEVERGASAAEDRVGELQASLLDSERSAARSQERLARLDKLAFGIAAAKTRRDKLQDEQTILGTLERACGQNGVPALILENVAIPQIETEASRILARLGGPAYGVELRTLRETKSGSVADALDIVCLTATGDAPYENFSTGERARIALALRLALAQLLANRKGSATGLLVLDDIGGLDAGGIAALVEVLEELKQSISKIIIVSQVAELRDAFERTLLLENVDGRTRVVEAAVA